MARNDVTIDLGVNTKSALKSIKSFASGSKSVFDSAALGVTAFNQGLDIVSRGLNVAASAFNAVVTPALEFSESLAEIQTLLQEGEVATADLSKTILGLQKQFGGTQKGIATAYYDAISSGAVDAANATEFLTSANKLAVGGVTEISTAVDGLTTIISSFGLEADDAATISDALFIGMKRGKTTVDQLSSGISIAAAQAGSLNVDFRELLAATSALTTGGVATKVAFTQIRAVMTGLTKPSTQLKEIFDELGVESIEAKLAQDGLVDTLKEVVGQTDGSAEAMGKLFGQVEAIQAVTALTSNTIGTTFVDTLDEMEKSVESAGNTSDKAFGKIANSAKFQFDKLKGVVSASLTEVGQVITNRIGPVLKVAQRIAGRIGAALKSGLSSAANALSQSPLFSGQGLEDTVVSAINLMLEGMNLLQKALIATTSATLALVEAFLELGGVNFVITNFRKGLILIDGLINKIAKGMNVLAGTWAFLSGDFDKSLELANGLKAADEEFAKLSKKFNEAESNIDFSETISEIKIFRDSLNEVGEAASIAFEKTSKTLRSGGTINISTKTSGVEFGPQLPKGGLPGDQQGDKDKKNAKDFWNQMAIESKKAAPQITTSVFTAITSADKKGAEVGAKQLIATAGVGIAAALGAGPFAESIGALLELLMTDGAADLVVAVVEQIPTMVEKLAENMPLVALALAQVFLDPLFYVRITAAFVNGFAKGAVEAVNKFNNTFINTIQPSIRKVLGQIGQAGMFFLQSVRDGFPDFWTDVEIAFKSTIKDVSNFLNTFFRNLGKAIASPFEYIYNLFVDLGDRIASLFDINIGGGSGGLVPGLPFSDGGTVPEGYPNDTFPARLTSGETVIRRDTSDNLDNFLERQGVVEGLLLQLVDAVSKPMNVQTAVEVDGQAFADIQLQLSRQNARTAV